MNKKIGEYNVIFDSPSLTDRGAMPLGNGETGISLWATSQKLFAVASRSDSLTECDRNVKLGRLEVSFEPNILQFSQFRQELILEEGAVCITLQEGERVAKITSFVSADEDLFRMHLDANFDVRTSCLYTNWRKEVNHNVNECGGNLTQSSGVCESADKTVVFENGSVTYHRNECTIIPYLAKLEALEEHLSAIHDNLLHRTFGAVCRLVPSERNANGLLSCFGKNADIVLYTFSEQAENENEYIQEQIQKSDALSDYESDWTKTKQFWKEYFEKSYIYVENDVARTPDLTESYQSQKFENTQVNATDSCVTRAYILSKYMHRCCIGAKYPIRFNGGHFNPGIGIPFGAATQPDCMVSATPEPPELGKSADERSWGNMLLWQNERLPYHALFAQNDTEPIRRFLEYYCSFDEINRIKAKKYYGAEGAYNTEIMTSFGLMPDFVYGVDRSVLSDGYCENRYGGAVDISPGLEQSCVLLKFCEFTNDTEFFNKTALPYIKSLFRYIETRFKNRENGKIVLEPLNSIETYWDTKNPVTVVAGMKAVLKELKKFELSASDTEYFNGIEKSVPEYSYTEEQGKKVLKPAQEFKEERHNVEIPQLYTVFPFVNQTEEVGKDIAVDTYQTYLSVSGNDRGMLQGAVSSFPSYSGWHYEGIVAALLGLTDEAAKILEYNCSYNHCNARFPAMWGPAYDSIPDIDHGANIQTQLQAMLMRCEKDTIYLCPAFPKEWNCKFRLWADKDTFVETEVKRGVVQYCKCNNPMYKVVFPENFISSK